MCERECGRERGSVWERRRGSVWETGRVFGRVWKSSEKGHRVCVWDEALDVAKSR